MEVFLQIFTICFLFLIGGGLFSLLLSVSERVSGLLMEDEAQDEERYAKALADAGIGEDDEQASKLEIPALAPTEKRKRMMRYHPVRLLKQDYVCDNCGSAQKPYELIPVCSFLFAKGKCRYCGKPLPVARLLAEIFGGLLFLLIFARFGKNGMLAENFGLYGVLDVTAPMTVGKGIALVLMFLVAALLFLVALIDQKTMIIPNGLSLTMLVFGIAGIFVFPEISPVEHLIGMVAVSLPMFLMTLLIEGAFGGGDIKLMAGAGLLLGWRLVLVAVFIGIVTGGIFGSALLIAKKAERKAHFPFGPFLCLGIMAAAVCGWQLLGIYLSYMRGFF